MGKCRYAQRASAVIRIPSLHLPCRFFPLPTALPAAAASLIPPSDLSDLPQLWSLARSSPTARSVSLSGSISVSASVPVLNTLCTHSSASSSLFLLPRTSPSPQALHPQLWYLNPALSLSLSHTPDPSPRLTLTRTRRPLISRHHRRRQDILYARWGIHLATKKFKKKNY
ncbi:hypothetical protein B0H11DRAFT_805325 [Mycena galericulata]|nr:hypothetical protein B0H11DRAFT_805325 [Mycena galericulata]